MKAQYDREKHVRKSLVTQLIISIRFRGNNLEILGKVKMSKSFLKRTLSYNNFLKNITKN